MHISKKIAKGIGIILKARKVFDNVTLFSLYYAFIYPYLNTKNVKLLWCSYLELYPW